MFLSSGLPLCHSRGFIYETGNERRKQEWSLDVTGFPLCSNTAEIQGFKLCRAALKADDCAPRSGVPEGLMGVAPRRTRAQGCGLLAARHNWPGVTSGRRRPQTEKSLDAPAPAINRPRMAQGRVKLTQQTRRSVWSQGRAGPPSGPKSKEEERVWLAARGGGMSVTGLSRSHVGKSLRALEATANQSTCRWKFTEPLCTRGWVTGNQGE